MPLEKTWRWFGPNDPIGLPVVKQTGVTGVVTALHHIPTGEAWTIDAITRRKEEILAHGLTWSVAESIPVHEHIKFHGADSRRLIENYKTSIRNLGTCGIEIVCYNFMPVLDWSRTNLRVVMADGSVATGFESAVFAAFDLFILERPGAMHQYSKDEAERARRAFESLDSRGRERLLATVLLGFPGSGDAYTIDGLRAAVANYRSVGHNELQQNLASFLREIIPVAEESGVFMALHPDDPPWPLLGLPRIVSTESDIEQVLNFVDSFHNGLTLCTGSLGAGRNDIPAIAARFADRVHFAHLRNVTRTGPGDFVEQYHLEGDVDMHSVMKTLLLEQHQRQRNGKANIRMPFRPDHGHLLAGEPFPNAYPGYSLLGRLKGLSELRGLELGIRRAFGE